MQSAGTELNERRQALLELIVTDYINSAVPVASQQLAQRHKLKVSSATIRNDMAELEDQGYISRPHASAGGIPADRAYRFYVERVISNNPPSTTVPTIFHHAFHQDEGDLDELARAAANTLAHAVQNVAIATSPRFLPARLKQIQLVQVQEHQALLVLVMHETRLRQHIVRLFEPTSQEDLDLLAKSLNPKLSGKTASQIRTLWAPSESFNYLASQVVREVLRLMLLEEHQESERHYVEGLGQMLGQPEFSSGVRVREVVELLENASLLHTVLLENPTLGEVRVIIGEENRDRHFRPYSIVIARYGVPGKVVGSIGTLGPTRMDYMNAISSVRYMANFLSSLFGSLDGSR